MRLPEAFKTSASHYTENTGRIKDFWGEIEKAYSTTDRHYHTLHHLTFMHLELSPFHSQLADADAVWFALFYHDAVYDVRRTDNEDKSATLALQRLAALSVPEETMRLCREHIMATRAHTLSDNPDSNLFMDADLSILGQHPDMYHAYSTKIRQEYSIYPDAVYNEGRRQVLNHFLQEPYIFKTTPFREIYEQQARFNIGTELKSL
jgi:predicted metal-dependent HD superfamily phosphohydrolase